jgi:hypothetical protein
MGHLLAVRPDGNLAHRWIQDLDDHWSEELRTFVDDPLAEKPLPIGDPR